MIVITGCSCVGKTSLAQLLLKRYPKMLLINSVTTRDPRPDDVNYTYTTVEEFKEHIKNDDFIDWHEVFPGCYYGIFMDEVATFLIKGYIPLIVTDNAGAKNFQRKTDMTVINLVPKDRANIEWRIRNFRTDHIEDRIKSLDEEIQDDGYFKHTFKLKELDECIEEIYQLTDSIIGE